MIKNVKKMWTGFLDDIMEHYTEREDNDKTGLVTNQVIQSFIQKKKKSQQSFLLLFDAEYE